MINIIPNIQLLNFIFDPYLIKILMQRFSKIGDENVVKKLVINIFV